MNMVKIRGKKPKEINNKYYIYMQYTDKSLNEKIIQKKYIKWLYKSDYRIINMYEW